MEMTYENDIYIYKYKEISNKCFLNRIKQKHFCCFFKKFAPSIFVIHVSIAQFVFIERTVIPVTDILVRGVYRIFTGSQIPVTHLAIHETAG